MKKCLDIIAGTELEKEYEGIKDENSEYEKIHQKNKELINKFNNELNKFRNELKIPSIKIPNSKNVKKEINKVIAEYDAKINQAKLLLSKQENDKLEKNVLNEKAQVEGADVQKASDTPRQMEGEKLDVEYKLRYPKDNVLVFVEPSMILDRLAKDDPEFDVQNPKNQIGSRVQKAKDYILNYAKDNRWINPKNGSRSDFQKASFEPSIAQINNGKIGFEDGRHRILAAKELGISSIGIEVPKAQAEQFKKEFNTQTKNNKNETESKNEVETSNVGTEVRKGKVEPSSSKTKSPKAKGKQLTNNESNRLKVALSLDLYGVPLYDMIAQAMMSLKFSGNVLQEILGRKESVIRVRKNIKEDSTQRLNWTRGWKKQTDRIESVGRLSEIALELLSDTDREIYDSQDVLNVIESVIIDFTGVGKISTYLIDKYLDGDINSTIEETIEKRQQQAYEDYYGIPEGWDEEKGDWIDERYKKAHEGLLNAIDLLTDEDFESILNDSEAYFNSDEYKASLDAQNDVKLSSKQESKESKEYQIAKRAYDNKRKELYGSAMNDSADLFGNVKSQENSLFGDQTEKADEAKIAKALEPYKVRLDNAKKALDKANKDAQSQGTLFNAKKGNNTSNKSLSSTLKKLINRLQKAIKSNVFSDQELLKKKLKEYGMDYTKFMQSFNQFAFDNYGNFTDEEKKYLSDFVFYMPIDFIDTARGFINKKTLNREKIIYGNKVNEDDAIEYAIDKMLERLYDTTFDEAERLNDLLYNKGGIDVFKRYIYGRFGDFTNPETFLYNNVKENGGNIQLMRTPNGVIYGAKLPDGTIYINDEDIDLSSPIHEFSHLFEEMYPELWAEGVRLFRDSSGFKKALKEVQDNEAYSNLTEQQQASEALNNLIGNKGVGYFAKGVLLSKFQNWVNKLFKTIGAKIGKQFGIKGLELKADDKLDFFVNDVLGKLLGGKELQGETQSTATTKFSQEYENSPQFEKWKGENRLVSEDAVQDVKTGEPIVAKVYHGTTNEFYVFDSSVKGNIEGHLGKVNYFTTSEQDANENYLANGNDLTNRIEQKIDSIEYDLENLTKKEVLSEYGITSKEYDSNINNIRALGKLIAEKELLGGGEKVLDLYVKLNNPIVLGSGSTWFDALEIDETYLEDATKEIADEYGISEEDAKDGYDWAIRDRAIEMQGEGNKVVEALEKSLNDNGYDSSLASEIVGDNYYETEVDLDSIEKSLRKAELYDNEDGELASSQVIADLFYNLGFDGIILTDVSERFRNMGINESTSHIHVFDKYNNQIKLADGTNTTFNPDTNDIRFQVIQNPTQATKSEIENAISSLGVADSDYANDDSIDNYLSLNDAFETLAYTSIGDAQNMAKDLSAKYPELKDDFDSIINEASKPKQESKKVTNESDAIRTLISEEVDGRLYPTIVDSLGKFAKQDTAETTGKVQEREVSGEYVRLTLENMKDIAKQKALQLQEVLGEDWVKKSIDFFEREPFSGNPAIIIGLSNIISTDLDAQIKATTDIKELDALVALQNRMDRVVNRNGRVASLALNYRRIFTSFAQGDSVTDAMAGNNLTEESKKQIEVVKKALAEQPTDEQLNSVGNVTTPTTTPTKNTKSSRKTQTDSSLKSQIKNNAINSLTQVDANGKKITKTWQDAVREANEEIKKHKC